MFRSVASCAAWITCVLLLLLGNVGECRGGKILVGYAADAKSHLRSLLPFTTRLAEMGHEVTMFYVRTNASGEPEQLDHPNLKALMVELPMPQLMNTSHMATAMFKETMHAYKFAGIFYFISLSFDAILDYSAPQVVEALNADWDFVVVSELFALHANAFGRLLRDSRRRVPYGVFSSSCFLSSDSYKAAVGQNWVSKLQMFTTPPWDGRDVFEPRSFTHRLLNVFEHMGEHGSLGLAGRYIMPKLMAKLTGKNDYSQTKFIRDSSLIFTDSIELNNPGAGVTELLNVGSHCEVPKPLEGDYLKFVEDPTSKGTVYIAFGTFIPWDFAPEEMKEAMFSALEQFSDYRILFAYKGEFPKRTLGKHIKLVKWAPQLDVLAHASTRVFLTHGGLKSVKEALCTRTPMLVMPMFAEQNHNARMVLALGIGSALNKFRLSAAGVAAALREVLERPAYAQRVAKLQRVFLDGGPLPALDLGAHRVSRLVAAGRRKKQLRSSNNGKDEPGSVVDFNGPAPMFFERKGVNLTLVEYFHLDVILVVLILIGLVSAK